MKPHSYIHFFKIVNSYFFSNYIFANVFEVSIIINKFKKNMRVNKINVFLCFIFLFTFSISTDVAFETLTPSIPGTIYPYTFTSGQVLVLTATWTTTADIDLFMYPAGNDIFTGAV